MSLRERTRPGLGVIEPCLPSPAKAPPSGAGWLHEIKHDGFRILAWKQGERVKVWSRRGIDFTGRFSRVADAVRGVSADEAIIDGEAVVFRDDGRSRWADTETRRHTRLSGESSVAFIQLEATADSPR